MKIYNENIDLDFNKIIYTNNFFKLTNNIKKQNKNIITITPWTKYSDIFNFNKDNPLLTIFKLEDNLEDKIVNMDLLSLSKNNVNDKIGFDLTDYELNSSKNIKNHFSVSSETIKIENLINILKALDNFLYESKDILIIGFDELNINVLNYNFIKINICILTNNLKNSGLNLSNLESLIIHYSKQELLNIIDIDAFINWLELKCKTVLTPKDISMYFNNELNFNSFLIEKSLKSI